MVFGSGKNLSGIRKKPIPEKTYSGSRVKKAPDPGSQLRIRNAAYLYLGCWALWDDEQHVNRFGSFAAWLSPTHNRESPARTVPPAHRK